jgi:hypothetical protein
MTKNILKTALAVISAGSLMTGCTFDQPEAGCFVQDSSNWYATYDLVDSPKKDGAACTDVPPLAERVGVFKFVDPDHPEATPKLTIRPNGTAARALDDSGPSTQQTAMGDYATEPDADEFCGATNFTVASLDAVFVPARPPDPKVKGDKGDPARPALTVSYEFTNVRVYSAPSAPGTQLTGDLKYTKNGCTSTYVVRAMWPAKPCIQGTTAPATNCGEGSGLNPDFAAECANVANCGITEAQAEAGYDGCCIPSKAIPSFNTTES